MTNPARNRAINEGTIAPVNRYPERARQEIEKIDAHPTADEYGRRSGISYAAEGLAWDSHVRAGWDAGAFAGPANHRTYESQIASANGRSGVADLNLAPQYAAVPEEVDATFMGSAVTGDRGQPGAPFSRRGGAENPQTITPLYGVLRGERENTNYRSQVVPEEASWRKRRNIADLDGFA